MEVTCQDLHRVSNRSVTAGTSPRWVLQPPLSPSPSSQSTATSAPPGATSAAQSSLPGPEAFLHLRGAGPQVRVVLRVLEVVPAGDDARGSEKVDVGGKLQRCLFIGSTELTVRVSLRGNGMREGGGERGDSVLCPPRVDGAIVFA